MSTPTPLQTYIEGIQCITAAKQHIDEVSEALGEEDPSEELRKAWQTYHDCLQKLDAAWQHLSEEQRAALRPPERYH